MNPKAQNNPPIENEALRLIKISEVLAICAISRSSLYALVRDRAFPAPVKLSERSSAWVHGEVLDWVAAKMRARSDQ